MYVDPLTGRVAMDRPDFHPISILYRMTFQDGEPQVFRVLLDRSTLRLLSWPEGPVPEWTRLENHRCGPCRLDPAVDEHCPVAVALSGLAETFRSAVSWAPVDLWVETEQRNYQRRTTLQCAVSSLAGIYMTTAGCPVLNRMRPLVMMHLPLQTQTETTQRLLSLFLYEQWARFRRGLPFDLDLRDIQAYLEQVSSVNVAFSERLATIPDRRGDATLNALVILDSLAMAALVSTEAEPMRRWFRLLHVEEPHPPGS